MGRAVDPPAGLVGLEHGALQGSGLDLEVPGEEDLPQPMPDRDQAAGGELELEMEVEDIDDLRQRGAQQIVQPGREDHDPQPDRRSGQGIGHDRLDGGVTAGAPVARDGVLGDDRGDVGGDVLDDPGPRGSTASDRPVALGAGLERVMLARVDPRRRRATSPRVTGPGPPGLGPALGGRLGVRRGLARGGGGIGSGRGRLSFGQLLGEAQQGKDDGLLALLVDQHGLLGRQLRAEQDSQGSGITGVRRRRGHRHSEMSRAADFKIN